MKKFFLFSLGGIFIATGILIMLNVARSIFAGYGALYVTANVKSNVYLNDKNIGTTPLCKCNSGDTIKEGEYDIKIIPDDKNLSPFSYKINITKDVLTAVNRTFFPGSYASAYILSLEKTNKKTSDILVTSIPQEALVGLDGNDPQGITPFVFTDISEGTHEIDILKEGYEKKTIEIKTIPYYKSIADVILGTKEDAKNSTVSANLSGNPQTASVSANKTNNSSSYVKITATPNGFLRVREQPSIESNEISRLNTGDVVQVIQENNGWLKVQVDQKTQGWISSEYTEKTTNQ